MIKIQCDAVASSQMIECDENSFFIAGQKNKRFNC